MNRQEIIPGCFYHPAYLYQSQQTALVDILRGILTKAPLFRPLMPRTGKPFSVAMSNCGPLGWVSDRSGYRYQHTHPTTQEPWPEIPHLAQKAWHDLSGHPFPPQACLINWYAEDARMGLHQDRDEEDFSAPIVSLSLGDTALFRIGGTKRSDKTVSIRLHSGDAIVFGGAARLAFHGIDRLFPGTSTLLSKGGRINLTLRRVTAS